MGPVPLHPALVHIPLGIAVAAPVVAAVAAFALWHGLLPRGVFAVLLALQLLALGGGILAYEAGEREEDRVEAVVGERSIASHQRDAERFLWSAGIASAISAAVLVLRKPGRARTAAVASVAAAVIAAALGVSAGKSGGAVAYGGVATVPSQASDRGGNVRRDAVDDDD